MAARGIILVGEYLAVHSALAVDDACAFQPDPLGVFRIDERRAELGIEALEQEVGCFQPIQLLRLDRVVGDLRAAAQDGIFLDAQDHAALQSQRTRDEDSLRHAHDSTACIMTGIHRLLDRLSVHGRPIAFRAMGRDVEDLGLGGVKRG